MDKEKNMNKCSKEIEAFLINVKKLRIENHLSKNKMAKKLNISVYTLNKIENGILPPKLTVEIVFKINKEFGIKSSEQFILNSSVIKY